ncbi:S9 family peptidase [Zavarzinella formosa]|uniref:S9 family peptidase n=1 Tax=Zavarzinella formosa TaxID=360055 RepID=UPI0003135D79|nr:S9 family peptidase [Zavarzinella formosa]
MAFCRLLPLLGLLIGGLAWGQDPDPARLTLDRIFSSEDFRPEPGRPFRWIDAKSYAELEPSTKFKGAGELFQVEAATGKKTLLIPVDKLILPGAKEPLKVQDFAFSKDLDLALIFTNSARVWRRNTRGDYWTFRRSTGKLVKLGGDAKPSSLMFAKLSPDGQAVGYVRENNLFVEPADGGAAVKLTADGSEEIINGTFDWVYEEEFDCRDGWRWSPDGKQIAYWQLDTRGVPRFTMIDHTGGNYPKLTTFAYPKTGERNSACRTGVVSATGGPTRWLDVPGDTKTDYYIPRMEWAENPTEIVLQRVNRLQNSNDVMLANPDTGRVRTVFTERDGAWLDMNDDALHWIDGGKAFTWISERDGWRHLYVVSRDGNTIRRVTAGAFDVIRVLKIDEKADCVYFLASPDQATRQYLYRTSLKETGEPERLTPADQTGWNDYQVRPDNDFAIWTHSKFGVPPQTRLIELAKHTPVRPLQTNDKLAAAVGKLARTPVEFFKVDIGGGIQLDGWLMKPPGFDETKKYPILFHVYGEPAGQTVVDRWGGNNYLWHLMLAQQGYLVASVDNRGTHAPRGRDWRKSVYRKIGTLASQDQSAAARELLKRPYIDPARLGVWGWSGGGSMSLNLLFRHPDLYHTGMAVAAVPDMRLYDTIYQERYMGLPQANAEDYKEGSPLTHAAKLKGNLLIVHGTGDDNVHYQGAEKLVDLLIAENKTFTVMPYPNRSHSINEGKNTSRHLYGLLTRYLTEHLPAGPKS